MYTGGEVKKDVFSFHGGLPWIDFINTQSMTNGEVRDRIQQQEDLLLWYREAGIAVPDADDWTAIWPHLRAVRTHLRELAEEAAETHQVGLRHIEWLNAELAAIPGRWQVAAGEARFVPLGGTREQLAWPLLHSAMDFLVHHPLDRLKKCGNHQCIQYYYDTSKNNTRRWCRMEVCGNREKAKRHYRKKCNGGQIDE